MSLEAIAIASSPDMRIMETAPMALAVETAAIVSLNIHIPAFLSVFYTMELVFINFFTSVTLLV